MKQTVTIGSGDYRVGNAGCSHKVLQRAVDDVAKSGGGTVEIPAGVYQMRDALHLRDGIDIVGEPGTILQKVPSAQSKLTHVAGFGHYEFAIAEPEKFEVGDGVLLADDNAFGFYTTAATIIGKNDEFFFIDKPFAHDYRPDSHATVTSIHSLLDGHGVQNASVRNLILDGNYPQEQNQLNGCRGGGIFLLQAHNITLKDVEVRGFHGDAISFQQCTDITVESCLIHGCTGGGLHPGSGSVRYVMRNNRVEDNGGCGIFYCLRTTHSLCEGNTIRRNGRDGISVGERDTDHIIRGNIISENGDAGVALREPTVQSGDRVWIEGNELHGNNTAGNFAEFYVAHDLHDVVFIRNKIEADRGPAVVVGPRCSGVFLVENLCGESTLDASAVIGDASSVSYAAAKVFPTVGPEAAKGEHLRHLGIDSFVRADA